MSAKLALYVGDRRIVPSAAKKPLRSVHKDGSIVRPFPTRWVANNVGPVGPQQDVRWKSAGALRTFQYDRLTSDECGNS
jgi:hypothetical protein